ncbi:MAG: hypothetical protein WDN30_10230 [Pararobbsia sp.]
MLRKLNLSTIVDLVEIRKGTSSDRLTEARSMRHVAARAWGLTWVVYGSLAGGDLHAAALPDTASARAAVSVMSATSAVPATIPVARSLPASSARAVVPPSAASSPAVAPAFNGRVAFDWRPATALPHLPLDPAEQSLIDAHGKRLVVWHRAQRAAAARHHGLRRGVYGMSVDFVEAVGTLVGAAVEWRSFDDRAAMLEALRAQTIDIATSSTLAMGNAVLRSRPLCCQPACLDRSDARASRRRMPLAVSPMSRPTRPRRVWRLPIPRLLQHAYPRVLDALEAVVVRRGRRVRRQSARW